MGSTKRKKGNKELVKIENFNSNVLINSAFQAHMGR